MEQQNIREDVVRVVRRLGFAFSYMGTSSLVDAVVLCVQDPEALTAVTKRVYPVIARKKGTKWRNVERKLRTAMPSGNGETGNCSTSWPGMTCGCGPL